MKTEYRLLKEVCEIKKGKLITQKDTVLGDVPVIAGGKKPAYFHNKYNFSGNVITVSASGAYAGYVQYHTKPIFASDCSTIQSFNENKVLTKYIYYFLKNKQKEIYNFQKGSGQPHVYPSDLFNIKVLIPSIESQNKIVSMGNRIEYLQSMRANANENTLNILKAAFFEMFGNPFKPDKRFNRVKLSEICEINPPKSEVKSLPPDTKVSFIEMASVSEEGEITNSVKKNLKEVTKGFTYFRNGDILFAKITPCMENGKGAIAKGLNNNIGFGSTEFFVFRVNEKVLPEWLFFLSRLSIFREYCRRNMTGTAGQKRVPRPFLENMEISLPPIELQKEFLEIYMKTEKLKILQRNSTFEINKIYQNLIQNI